MLLRRHKDRRVQPVKQPVAPLEPKEPKALEDMTAEELQAYAEANGIDIGRATSADGILKKIQEAAEPDESEGEQDTDQSTDVE